MESPFRPELFRRRRVLVTGGSSGIGRSIAEAFERHGAQVIIMSRDEARLRKASDEIGGLGMGGCTYQVADVRDKEAVAKAAEDEASRGGIDILINAAAGNFPAPFHAMSDNAWETVIDIVLNGTANVTRAFQEQLMGKADANIINIVAGYAWTGAPGVSHSGAAKAGVLNLTRSLAVEWAPVRVNAISPGPIAGTEGMKRLADDLGMGGVVEKSVPAGRLGQADEVANAALFLASQAASYISGACLVVDGGQDAVGPFGALWTALKG